jgi:hypothetical protein
VNQQNDSADGDNPDASDPDAEARRAGAPAGSNLFDGSGLAAALAPTWQPAIEIINASIRSTTTPSQKLAAFAGSNLFDSSKLVSTLSLISRPAIEIINASFRSTTTPLLGQTASIVRRSFAQNTLDGLQPLFDALPHLADLTRGVWPANLSRTQVDFDVDTLKMLMLDEGLPIAWVPRPETIGLVFVAESPAARRAVYGRRWRSVVNDCEELTDKMNSVATTRYIRFLQATIRSLREGHSESAQALAATVLDTAVAEFFDKDTYKQWIWKKERIEPGELSVRKFFMICQLWGIHRRFHDGDPIPGTFNRHGTVHAVSARQYSRLNAVLGLAHLTSFLWAIDSTYGARGRT